MAKKPSNAPRRAPKHRFARREYYPKVDLSDLEDRPPSSWSISGVPTSAEAAAAEAPTVETPVVEAPVVEDLSASEEKEVMSSPVAISQPPFAAKPEPIPAPAAASPPAKDALRLPGSLDLPAARPLANSLVNRRGQPIVIDASAVTQIGAQCVQVLLSAKRAWKADGLSLSIVNFAPRMIEDLALLGIDWKTLSSGESPQ